MSEERKDAIVKDGTEQEVDKNVVKPVGDTKYKFTPLDKKMLRKETLPDDPDELSGLLESEGIDITSPAFQRQLEVRKAQAARQADEHRKRTRTRVDGYDTTRNRILSARDYVALFFSFVFGVLSMLLTTLLLYVSEIFSTMAGIRSFLVQDDKLTIAIVVILAVTLVSSYFAIEWRLAALISKNGKPPVYRFTFKAWGDRLNYVFGRTAPNTQFQYEVIENAADIRAINSTRRIIIAIIVILGILGRLQSLLSVTTDLAWYEQIVSIFTTSSLQTFLEYIGGGAIALALLVATHYLMSYIYEVYRNAVGGADEAGFFDPALQDKLEQQMVTGLYRYKLQQIWVEREDQVRQYIEDQRMKQLEAKNRTIEGIAVQIPSTATVQNSNELLENSSSLSNPNQITVERVEEKQERKATNPPVPPIPPPISN